MKQSAREWLGTKMTKCVLEKQCPVPNQRLQLSTIICCLQMSKEHPKGFQSFQPPQMTAEPQAFDRLTGF